MRPPRRKQHSLSRAVRAAAGEPAGRFGQCDHLGVAVRRTLLPAVLLIGQGLADGGNVDDNHPVQPSALGAIVPGFCGAGLFLLRRGHAAQ